MQKKIKWKFREKKIIGHRLKSKDDFMKSLT